MESSCCFHHADPLTQLKLAVVLDWLLSNADGISLLLFILESYRRAVLSLFVVGGAKKSQVRVFYGKGKNCDSEFQQTSEKLLKSHMLGGGFRPSGLG